MKHPLDQFLNHYFSDKKEEQIPSFEEFQENWKSENEGAQLDQWLKNQSDAEKTGKVDFNEFLAFQEKQESLPHPLDEWLKSTHSTASTSERFSFFEFRSYWNLQILKKWSRRVAFLLFLLLGSWGIYEQVFLSTSTNKAKQSSTLQPTSTEIEKKSTSSSTISSETLGDISNLRGLKNHEPILKEQKIRLLSNKKGLSSRLMSDWNLKEGTINSPTFPSGVISKSKNKSNIVFSSIELINQTNNLNNSTENVFRDLELEQAKLSWQSPDQFAEDYTSEKVVLEALKSKQQNLSKLGQRDLDLPVVKSQGIKRNFVQISLLGGSSNQMIEYLGEKNKNWDELQKNKLIPQMNLDVQWSKPGLRGIGWGVSGKYSHSTLRKEVEYHITEIPVLDSATGRILGYISLGPRGQIHMEEELEVIHKKMNIQGSIFKGWKITPSFEVGIQQNIGIGLQKSDFQKVIDPISLEIKSLSSKVDWEGVGKSSIWFQSRLSNHLGIGGQISRPFSLQLSNKNSLIFREMSIFEAGISVRYYLKTK